MGTVGGMQENARDESRRGARANGKLGRATAQAEDARTRWLKWKLKYQRAPTAEIENVACNISRPSASATSMPSTPADMIPPA